jgi:hypothetical protein
MSVGGDVLDKLELFHQFLPPAIKPLRDDMVVICRAMPVLGRRCISERVIGTGNSPMREPFD